MLSDLYIYKKEVNWSLLHLGINIHVTLQSVFYDSIKLKLNKGDRIKIRLILNGQEYATTLTNIYFDQSKYPMHKELLQIRYTPNSDIAMALRAMFWSSYDHLKIQKDKLENKRKQLSTPEGLKEYLAIYSTPYDDCFLLECITWDEIQAARQIIQSYNEFDLEQYINSEDRSSTFIHKEQLVKIRKLDKSIGDNLKMVYQYKCQICGEYVGEKYNTNVIHAHHIEPFTKSLNNNANNILITCPNHHGIIHATNPIFNRKEKSYIYPNGYIEKLMSNIHL